MEIIYYLVTGMIAGTMAGLLGVGGGLLIVPVLLFVFQQQLFSADIAMHLAVGTSLASIIFTSVSSVYAHHKRHAVLWDVVFCLSPGILVGALSGAWFAGFFPADALRQGFGFFELYVAIQMSFNIKPKASRGLPKTVGMIGAGGVIGGVSSIVGIGGGTLTVPFLVWCNTEIRQAVATSAACGLPIAVAGATGFLLTGLANLSLPQYSVGFIYLPALFSIVATSVLFAPLGSQLAHQLAPDVLKKVFALILLWFGRIHAVSLMIVRGGGGLGFTAGRVWHD